MRIMNLTGKQLRKSENNKVLGGVAGGLGDYFNIDPVLVRVLFVFGAVVSSGAFVMAYIALWLIMPDVNGEMKLSRMNFTHEGKSYTVNVPTEKHKNDDPLHYARPIQDLENLREKTKRDDTPIV